MAVNRRQREAKRLRFKRRNPDYLAAERKANRKRMRKRRGDRNTPYVELERSQGYWQ
jgi:hypothetical protein